MICKVNWKICTLFVISYALSVYGVELVKDPGTTIAENPTKCGIKNEDGTSVLTGYDTIQNEYPWVVGIYNADNYICGGTIISSRYILSAAVCYTNNNGVPKDTSNYTIVAGKYFRALNRTEEFSQARKVKNLFIHEDYRGALLQYINSIALIELNKELDINRAVQPICVDWEGSYSNADFTDGKEGIIAGWGSINAEFKPQDTLIQITAPYRSRNDCLENLPQEFAQRFFTSDRFCAGYTNKNLTICQGFSGSGLFFKSDGTRYFIRGIAGFAVRSELGCDTNHYVLYTNVSRYLSWLTTIIKKKV